MYILHTTTAKVHNFFKRMLRFYHTLHSQNIVWLNLTNRLTLVVDHLLCLTKHRYRVGIGLNLQEHRQTSSSDYRSHNILSYS